MNAENVITLCIMCLVALIFIGLGISQYRSKKPVGFYSGEKPPKKEELTDVKAWNRKHGVMWFGYGVMLILSGVLFLVVDNETVCMIIMFGIMIGGLIGLFVGDYWLRKKYLIK